MLRIPDAMDPMCDPAFDPMRDAACDPISEGADWDLSDPDELLGEMMQSRSAWSWLSEAKSLACSPIVDKPAFLSFEPLLSLVSGARPEIGHLRGDLLSCLELGWSFEPSIAA